ncbi:type II toxin-antitoxin system HicA family toxin [Candidatus Thiosymbion oneisti]|nr:type II toxin-antitoxin system HicA family toxin [Candidatus Thiosymbion oneisti]
MKVKELIALIEADGWLQVRHKGSHRRKKQKKGHPYCLIFPLS